MSGWAGMLIGLAVLAGVFLLVDRAMVRRERAWDDGKAPERGPTLKVGNALLEVQSLFDPGAKHALEERRAEKREESEPGDPPEPGKDDPAPS